MRNAFQSSLNFDLAHQALDATLTHAQANTNPTDEQLRQIVNFELSTYTGQQFDYAAGDLAALGAQGGACLSLQGAVLSRHKRFAGGQSCRRAI